MKALSAAQHTNWDHQVEDDQQWMGLWQIQREEVTARLHHQNTEKRQWNEISGAYERGKRQYQTKLPTSQGISNSPRVNPAQVPPQGFDHHYERTVELRNRISALSETKQILLSQFVNVRAPHAITKDATGMATIDPYRLDAAAFGDVMTHLRLLEEESKPKQADLPNSWQTGYVGDLPPRDRTTGRPNGTIGSGRAQPGSRASFTWEDMQVQPLPPKIPTPRKPAFNTPMHQAAPPETTPQLTAEERAEREALANRIALLPEPHQRTVSQEVRLFCPQAIFQATPGYATINTSELDRRTYNRVKALVEELVELGKQDENTERERSIRRQVEREQFLARERARERERALDLEMERRAREEQIKEELERDLEKIRSEVETDRKQRWQKEGEEKRRLLLERSTPRHIEPQATQAERPSEIQNDEESVRPLRRKLAEILRELNDENMFAFADYALQLQPEAVDSHNNSIHPNRFDKVSLPLAVNYACQLKANQRPVYRLTAPPENQQAARIEPVGVGSAKVTPRTAQEPEQQKPSSVNRDPQVVPSDVEVALSPEQLHEREALSQAIVRLGRSHQRAVCDWLRLNAAHAIAVQDGSTSIETAVLSETEFNRLKEFIAARTAEQGN